jgi:hypothetical protein
LFDGMGRGLVTTDDLRSEEVILEIPSRLIFSTVNLEKQSKTDPVLKEISTSKASSLS